MEPPRPFAGHSVFALMMSSRLSIQLWPVHRRVCGQNSNPFTWPSFSDEEIGEMLAYDARPSVDSLLKQKFDVEPDIAAVSIFVDR